ncbi:uncharacterized protein EI90DRAFT_3086418 [Cantharellus anzutake]|uniref:uncharacterized protein n=1 Tax=Cantharellus anzutake TaxID=1750568 RepID=UPI0019085A3E|nr:uncharacterized protein EI90DRAFT_3086418 [Cantharellus anzutake]KAF8316493.1 hypothetical protein EI90DRAFT_3086418 [Cantharellus anzutake]
MIFPFLISVHLYTASLKACFGIRMNVLSSSHLPQLAEPLTQLKELTLLSVLQHRTHCSRPFNGEKIKTFWTVLIKPNRCRVFASGAFFDFSLGTQLTPVFVCTRV